MKAAAAEGIASAVLVPLSDGTKLIGMVQLLSTQASAPAPELMLSLEGIALQLSATARLLASAGTPQWRVGRL